MAALGMSRGRDLGGRLPRKVAIATLPKGWVVVLARRDAALKAPFTAVAALGPAVACFQEEHVMYSEARGYAGGVEAWRVVRDPEAEPEDDVAITGDPPASLDKIYKTMRGKQDRQDDDEVDFLYEIAPRLAKTVCGFRTDAKWPAGCTFIELDKGAGGRKPGFFQRLFGRG